MKKRIISMLLAVIAAIGLCTGAVFASSSEMTLCGFRVNDDSASAPSFITFSPDSPKDIEIHGGTDQAQIYCGTFFAGNYYCVDEGGTLIKVDLNTYTRTEVGKSLEDMSLFTPVEMSYDNHSGKLYLLCIDRGNNDANALYTVNISTGQLAEHGYLFGTGSVRGMTFDGMGNLYTVDDDGTLCRVDIASCRAYTIGETELDSEYIQSMCFDRSSNLIYWACYDGEGSGKLISIDPQTAAVNDKGAIGSNCAVTALCFTNDALEVTVVSEEGGIAYVSGNRYFNAGERATVSAEASKGYTFGGWIASGGTLGATNDLTTTLTLPNGDVRVTAFFVPKKPYQPRTLLDDISKVTVDGKKVYYNTELAVYPWTQGSDGYDKLIDVMGKKRELISAQVVELTGKGAGDIDAFKSKVKVMLPVSGDYEGKKVDLFSYDGTRVVKTTARVKDSQIVFKTDKTGAVAVTTHKGGSVWLIVILLLILGFIGFIIYVYRKSIKAQLKKNSEKIKGFFKGKKKNKSEDKQSRDIMEALDNQSLENSRYDIK